MENNLTVEQVINKWAIISIDRFQEQLVRLNVGEVDGSLMRSFTYQLNKSGGDAMHVLIKFLRYGRFVDMGVGKGHPLSGIKNVTSLTGNRYRQENSRVAKKWYGKVKTREVAILRYIMLKQFSIMTLKGLETELRFIDKAEA